MSVNYVISKLIADNLCTNKKCGIDSLMWKKVLYKQLIDGISTFWCLLTSINFKIRVYGKIFEFCRHLMSIFLQNLQYIK